MRLRITFAKEGNLRYTGHLDLQRIWERTTRRAGLPLAYTQGFHPGPKIQLAAALPLGSLSRAEIVDMWMGEGFKWNPDDEKSKKGIIGKLQQSAPQGLSVSNIEEVEERSPALQTLVMAAEYRVDLLDPINPDKLQGKVKSLLAKTSLPRERRGRKYDLRPFIEALSIETDVDSAYPALAMRLSAREGATGRPDEVLAELGIPLESARIERTRLFFIEDIQ